MKLFLKGERCYTDKCAVVQREYPPGQHGQGRIRTTEYRFHPREKQKVRSTYGVSEAQFKKYYEMAKTRKGVTGELLLQFLERRLDNIVYRLGFAPSRNAAKQFITHGHVMVNGRKVNVPSYMVSVGDTVEVKEKSRKSDALIASLENQSQRGWPDWLEVDKDAIRGKVKLLPERKDLPATIQETLIIEYYSK